MEKNDLDFSENLLNLKTLENFFNDYHGNGQRSSNSVVHHIELLIKFCNWLLKNNNSMYIKI